MRISVINNCEIARVKGATKIESIHFIKENDKIYKKL